MVIIIITVIIIIIIIIIIIFINSVNITIMWFSLLLVKVHILLSFIFMTFNDSQIFCTFAHIF